MKMPKVVALSALITGPIGLTSPSRKGGGGGGVAGEEENQEECKEGEEERTR